MSPQNIDEDIYADYEVISSREEAKNNPDRKTILKHLGLFLLTFVFVTMSGANFVGFEPVLFPFAIPSAIDIWRGFVFASLLLAFLTVHEFGHYFAAVYHKVQVTLPYYIPIPLGIGTLGAVIRIKERIRNIRKLFDVGSAGPVAGFIVSLAILIIGFATLPEPDYMLQFSGHDELKSYIQQNGTFPEHITDRNGQGVLTVGNTLLYSALASLFENVPPMWEMYHYPFLFAGWLGLFFTALNLMPVGQLDGGHILYSLIGYKNHKMVARIFFTIIVTMAGIGFVPWIHDLVIEYDNSLGMTSWLIWALLLYVLMSKAFHGDQKWIGWMFGTSIAISAVYLYFIAGGIRGEASLIWLVWSFFIAYIVRVEHPPVDGDQELSKGRKVIGWLSMLIFLLCISPNPLYMN